MYRSNTSDCRIYIGNLPDDVRSRDIEDVFTRYGKIIKLEVKQPRGGRGPAFAFLEYEDPRDAEDAVRERDNYDLDGNRIRVQFPQSKSGGYSDSYRGGGGGGGGGSHSGRGGRGRGRGGGPPRRSDYRVLVSGLPPTGSWQDIKDHLREAGEVVYADVFRDGTGVVEFARRDDMEWAVRNLDDSRFKSHENETTYIRVKEDSSASRNRSRSPPPKNRSRSPPPSKNRSRSPPPSKNRSRSPPPSKYRSRSPPSRRSYSPPTRKSSSPRR